MKNMTIDEFKEHIKAICGPRPPEDKPCVRTSTDQPTPSETMWIEKNKLRIERELAGSTAKFTIGEAIDFGKSVKLHEESEMAK